MNESSNNKSNNNSDIPSGRNIYTNASSLALSGTISVADSSKRRGKQFRQRHDTQHDRNDQQHSAMLLQTRILSEYPCKTITYFEELRENKEGLLN
ncbi:unnamed protein product [Onchocerca ochengi]|uniref:Uncharacterized protein n=1 Tax=Onchocerca ochengi TaxID=42157 RepID=A0A182DX71_ONCOC|nr:unnamed protein product [Onchocerca ochengi]